MIRRKGLDYLSEQKLTFVIQGAVSFFGKECITERCAASIKTYFPDSKIIISTWENDPGLSSLRSDFYSVVKSTDPGQINTSNKYFSNYMRMMTSTYAGIIAADTQYVAKVRSDFYFSDSRCRDFIHMYNQAYNASLYNTRSGAPIMTCLSSTHYPLFSFYMSDWFNLGKRIDMEELWRIPSIEEFRLKEDHSSSSSLLSKTILVPLWRCDVAPSFEFRYHSEQQLCLSYLERRCLLDSRSILPSWKNASFKSLCCSERILSTIFIYISRERVFLRSFKHSVGRDWLGRCNSMLSRQHFKVMYFILRFLIIISLYTLRSLKLLLVSSMSLWKALLSRS